MTDEESRLRLTEAVQSVNSCMRAACPSGGKATTYTQETHSAFKTLIAAERVKTDLLEERVAALEAAMTKAGV